MWSDEDDRQKREKHHYTHAIKCIRQQKPESADEDDCSGWQGTDIGQTTTTAEDSAIEDDDDDDTMVGEQVWNDINAGQKFQDNKKKKSSGFRPLSRPPVSQIVEDLMDDYQESAGCSCGWDRPSKSTQTSLTMNCLAKMEARLSDFAGDRPRSRRFLKVCECCSLDESTTMIESELESIDQVTPILTTPILIRETHPPPRTPSPLFLRERPPSSLTSRRQLIYLRYRPDPPKPRNIVVERWLTPPQQKQQQQNCQCQTSNWGDRKHPRNVIVDYGQRKCYGKCQPVLLSPRIASPNTYVRRHSNELIEASTIDNLLRTHNIHLADGGANNNRNAKTRSNRNY